MNSLGILLVDDHQIVREGLRAVLAGNPRLRVVGEAADGNDACVKSATLQPDLVIMDVSMPGLNGADTTRRVLAASPHTHVIALSAHDETPYVRELLHAGARGYVLKRAVLSGLLRAIDVVADGGLYLDPELARQPASTPDDVPHANHDLSDREVEVASLTARGYANAEISAFLRISVKTVETHKSHLMAKLELQTRAQLVRYAIYRGWLTA